MRILDVGCGWGKIGDYIAREVGVEVHGLTISSEQFKFMSEHTRVRPILGDYRDISSLCSGVMYDAVYSIGAIEHFGQPNYSFLFEQVRKVLKPNGTFLIHTIVNNDIVKAKNTTSKLFVIKHIFPHGQIPENHWILEEGNKHRMSLNHFEMFGGQHYAETLKHWRQNMMHAKEALLAKGYTQEIIRTYEYYFGICEGCFRANRLGLSHFTFINTEVASVNHPGNFVYE
jgi:cyclopropane-fatty-acyl-phospholipid synthase